MERSKSGEIDEFDLKILTALSEDGRMTITQLAKRVGLSNTPCQVRLRKLMSEGYIEGFRAVLNPSRMGLDHVAFAEVKAWTPYRRDADMASVPPPSQPGSAIGSLKTESGHTEWVDGRVHQSGFTAAFPPNTVFDLSGGGTLLDGDWTNRREGTSRTIATSAAVTARSHHPGLVNATLLDGSVWDGSDPAGYARSFAIHARADSATAIAL